MAWSLYSSALVATVACSSESARDAGLDVGVVEDASPYDAGSKDARVIPPRPTDASFIVFHDAGAPSACTETCDCDQGLACLDGLCRNLGVGLVYCCENPGCPTGEPCLDPEDRPSTCPAPTPDAGPLPDTGPRDGGAGGVGAACLIDQDCDTESGLSCWDETEPPYLWDGYCTVEGCTPSCPTGSGCIAFNTGAAVVRGCMAICTTNDECRSDAYCRDLGNGTSVCYPRCRDDLYDCAPRNGSMYCNPESGACEPTPTHSTSAHVGDPCAVGTECGAGQVCLSEQIWAFTGGMCTRVCSGLPEATPCTVGETCQDFAGIGLCFANCDANESCPERPGAFCGTLFDTWTVPVCLPF
ncbi:MAG: hypothetical protein HY791_31700 [Deltaproteobacteria bacterium]|nr:hypothetical protein [Deltaproteobacteria bacterium]